MATIVLSGGINETEPTLIGDNELQDMEGAEYRVGQQGLFQARGRKEIGNAFAIALAIREASFDGRPNYILAHTSNSLFGTSGFVWRLSAGIYGRSMTKITGALSAETLDILETGSEGVSAFVGTHYANRHYLAMGLVNRKVEYVSSGITLSVIGMSRSTFTIGTSVTQGAGSMTVTTGLAYWVTEYDSTRGIESMTGSSVSTASFSAKNSVIVTVTGTSANIRADQLRWYRSVDGGGFPDGGLIATTAIGTTTITDTQTSTSSLTVPQYGIVSIGGLDVERDEPPPPFHTIFGPFQDSLLGVDPDDPRVLRFTPAGYPDSWPSSYAIPLDTERRDEIVAGVVLPGRIGVFCLDSVHVIYRLPRDSDSIFAAGEASDILTKARGCVSRKGACTFTPPGGSALAAWVARDGICISDLSASPVIITNRVNWSGRVDGTQLDDAVLVDDPLNQRLVFAFKRVATDDGRGTFPTSDAAVNQGLWYLDYQEFQSRGLRIAIADSGRITDAATFADTDGMRRLVSISRAQRTGQIDLEDIQDSDDSQVLVVDGSGSDQMRFRARTKEFLPSGARGSTSLGKATWMHDAGPSSITHRFYFNRRDSNPEVKHLPNPDTRNASDVVLGRSVNSVSLELESVGTTSYGVHWVDIEGIASDPLAGRKGA